MNLRLMVNWSFGRVVKALDLGSNGKPREFDPRSDQIFNYIIENFNNL